MVLTLPRQAGKSFTMLLLTLDRLALWPVLPQVTAFVSDTLATSMRLWRDQMLPLLRRPAPSGGGSLWGRLGLDLKRNLGDARLEALSTGSVMLMMAGSATSGHGQTLGLVVMDEAFSYPDERHEQALVPAMNTVPDAQLWIVSTAGNYASTYLRGKVDKGRVRVESGAHSGVAYFEWSAPEKLDWTDPETWKLANPALGIVTPLAKVQRAFESMSPSGFRRAYLNQWESEDMDSVFPPDAWGRALVRELSPEGGVFLAVDAPPERNRAVVVAANADCVEVIRAGEGLRWIPEYLDLTLANNEDVVGVAACKAGPASDVVAAFERGRRRVPVVWYDTPMLCRAAGQFEDGVLQGVLKLSDPGPDHPELSLTRG